MKQVVIFGTSLNPASRSQVLAREVETRLRQRGVAVTLIDLRELALPQSGRSGAFDDPQSRAMREAVAGATHVVFAVAIYNYSVSSAAKNLLELLTDDEMLDKIVGFVCAAGGHRSYMSVMGLANSLMLDFRSWIVPRYVYATKADFQDGKLASEDVARRLDAFVNALLTGPRGFQQDAAGRRDDSA